MFSLYLGLKFLHILAAIVAVGANVTYGVWSVRAQDDKAQLGFVLRGIKFLDDRIANPAYGVVVLTGIVMVIVGRLPIQLWIIVGFVLFVAVAVIGVVFFSPLVKRQMALVDAGDTSSPEFERLARRNAVIGPLLGVIVVVILAMMVFKPTL
jgi:uncharacterized membrane protein